ncbi:M20 family metallo-hydrolase (plasmid) [Klebsiella sp. B345]|uniref:M20 family metallo-hydrolase n=1 Tax=Klebsiella sp. B345 TaxID=2755398 RepID=UPI003DA82396
MCTLTTIVDDIFPRLLAWRRDFHLYAESGWLEFRTATLVAEELNRLGYQLQLGKQVINADARMGLPSEDTLKEQESRALQQGALARWLPHFSGGFCGIVANLETGRPGPVIAYRVDMDALDQNEQQDNEHRPFREGFASCNPGMMHACGHDGHTAIGLGLAHVFMKLKSELCGTIKLIFQPAEEGTRGAKSMVAAGVVDDVDFFTAMHIGTDIPAGEIVCGCHGFMATTKFDATFRGVASHAGARPEEGRNALLAAAQASLALHCLSQHSGGDIRINVGVLQAGIGRNVVADFARMKVETRGTSNEVNDFVYQQAQQVLHGAATMYGVELDIALMGGAVSSQPTAPWVDYIRRQAETLPEFTSVIESLATAMGSEDATYMMERVKTLGGQSSYVIFGTDLSAGHHNEKFDFDERIMPVAVKTLATLALNITNFKR